MQVDYIEKLNVFSNLNVNAAFKSGIGWRDIIWMASGK